MSATSGDPVGVPIPPAPSPDSDIHPARLEVESIPTDAGITVLVRGELDPATEAAFRLALEAASGDAPHVVVDLGEVTFMDSTGLAVLVRAHRCAVERHGSLVVRDPSPAIRRLLVITALDGVLVTERSEQVAGAEDPREERPLAAPPEPAFTVTNLEDGQVIEVRLDSDALAEHWPVVEPKILSLIRVRQPRELRLGVGGSDAAIDPERLASAREALSALGGRLVVERPAG